MCPWLGRACGGITNTARRLASPKYFAETGPPFLRRHLYRQGARRRGLCSRYAMLQLYAISPRLPNTSNRTDPEHPTHPITQHWNIPDVQCTRLCILSWEGWLSNASSRIMPRTLWNRSCSYLRQNSRPDAVTGMQCLSRD